ncbi:DUF2742 domain-containing protein [Mycolicibacterium smegmatis]|nr:DUF2742 domain-containing protein [Mycolicibacterium smegmatis]
MDWWSVWEYVAPLLGQVQRWPMAGTLAWQRLADDDPTKLASLYQAAAQMALRYETSQSALAEASHEISAGTDWSACARRVHRGRGAAYVPRIKAS